MKEISTDKYLDSIAPGVNDPVQLEIKAWDWARYSDSEIIIYWSYNGESFEHIVYDISDLLWTGGEPTLQPLRDRVRSKMILDSIKNKKR